MGAVAFFALMMGAGRVSCVTQPLVPASSKTSSSRAAEWKNCCDIDVMGNR
jgi:hypothetical protein